MSVVSGNS